MPSSRPIGSVDIDSPDGIREPLECATCGRLLDGDPEDEPEGESGLPLCGLCNRGRNFDALVEELSEDDHGW